MQNYYLTCYNKEHYMNELHIVLAENEQQAKGVVNNNYLDVIDCQTTLDRFYGRGLKKEFVDKIYGIAYDRGHSAGEKEVDSIFDSMMYDMFGLLDTREDAVDKSKIFE